MYVCQASRPLAGRRPYRGCLHYKRGRAEYRVPVFSPLARRGVVVQFPDAGEIISKLLTIRLGADARSRGIRTTRFLCVAHGFPVPVLLHLCGTRVFVPLQPVSEPVEVSFVGGKLVSRLELLVWLVGKHMEIRHALAHQGDGIVQRSQILLLRHLKQDRRRYLVQIELWRQETPAARCFLRRSQSPEHLQRTCKKLSPDGAEQVVGR